MELTGDTAGNVVVPSEYWKDQGPVPVKFIVIGVCEPEQIDAVPEIVAVGLGLMVILMGVEALTHPAALRTVSTALYNPDGTLPGMVNETGDVLNASVISVKPALCAAPSKSIVNSSGDP